MLVASCGDMLRISAPITERDGSLTLRLEGQVSDRWVAELSRVCADALRDGCAPRRLTLDLRFVSFLDVAGARLLRALAAEGISCVHASPFIAQLLTEADHAHQ
jgi:hypothetical protein